MTTKTRLREIIAGAKRIKALEAEALKPKKQPDEKIKIQVDRRTVIAVRGDKALKFWLEKYPNAKVIE
jgi:hypothetical protein